MCLPCPQTHPSVAFPPMPLDGVQMGTENVRDPRLKATLQQFFVPDTSHMRVLGDARVSLTRLCRVCDVSSVCVARLLMACIGTEGGVVGCWRRTLVEQAEKEGRRVHFAASAFGTRQQLAPEAAAPSVIPPNSTGCQTWRCWLNRKPAKEIRARLRRGLWLRQVHTSTRTNGDPTDAFVRRSMLSLWHASQRARNGHVSSHPPVSNRQVECSTPATAQWAGGCQVQPPVLGRATPDDRRRDWLLVLWTTAASTHPPRQPTSHSICPPCPSRQRFRRPSGTPAWESHRRFQERVVLVRHLLANPVPSKKEG